MTDSFENVLETFIERFSSSDQDEEEFNKRVFSFIEGQKWVSRTLILSPLICAQYGWTCVNPNLLKCVSCGAKLCTQEPKIEIYSAYKSCLNKIVADLKDGHKIQCPWPGAPSPESFVKMVTLPKEEALSQFVNRLKPCLDFESSVPHIKKSVLSELGLKLEDVSSLFKLAKITSAFSNEIETSMVCLAATGWTILSKKNGKKMTYIRCDSCQRSIWVKSFNIINASSNDDVFISKNGTNSVSESPSIIKNDTNSEKVSLATTENGTSSVKETSSTENGANSVKESSCKRNLDSVSSNETTPPKRFKLGKRDFDPLEEHRLWCRWVSSADVRSSEKGEAQETVPGWKLYMKSLLRNISNSLDNSVCTPSKKEHVRSIRDHVESWTSPSSP